MDSFPDWFRAGGFTHKSAYMAMQKEIGKQFRQDVYTMVIGAYAMSHQDVVFQFPATMLDVHVCAMAKELADRFGSQFQVPVSRVEWGRYDPQTEIIPSKFRIVCVPI